MIIPVLSAIIGYASVFVAVAIRGVARWALLLLNLLLPGGLLYIRHPHFMNSLLNGCSITFSYQERGDTNGAALAVIHHLNALDLVPIHNDGHDGAKLLDILHLFHEVAVAAIDHDDVAVAVEGCLLEMTLLKIRLLERPATILIRQRIMHPPLKNPVLLVGAEISQARLDQALVRHAIEVKLAGEGLRVQDIELVGGGEGQEQRHTSRYLLHFFHLNILLYRRGLIIAFKLAKNLNQIIIG